MGAWAKGLAMRPYLLLAGLAVAVYLNTLPAQFTFDDNFAVVYNGDVSEPSKPLAALLRNDFWGQNLRSEMSHKSYRPLTVLSFRLQRAAGQALLAGWWPALQQHRGVHPLVFHACSVCAHAGVTALVYRLALRLAAARLWVPCGWGAPGPRSSGSGSSDRGAAISRPQLEALVAALLFAVHPVHVEAVAGAVGQAELISAALSLAALLAYMAATERYAGSSSGHGGGGNGGSLAAHWWRVSLALALGWAAALAKEIGITIMGTMICYDALVVPLAGNLCPPEQQQQQLQQQQQQQQQQVEEAKQQQGEPQPQQPQQPQQLSLPDSPALRSEERAKPQRASSAPTTPLLSPRAAAAAVASKPQRRQRRQSSAATAAAVAAAASQMLQQAAAAKKGAATTDGSSLLAPPLVAPNSPSSLGTAVAEAMEATSPGVTKGAVSSVRQLEVQMAAFQQQRRQALHLKLQRMGAAAVAVLLYVQLRGLLAGDQLVRIYRKVENPIPFAPDPWTRKLTAGYLHARYASLLLAPVQLSADWSFACIDYVHSLKDPRNLATAGLYLALLYVLLTARPWRVLAEWADAARGRGSSQQLPPAMHARRWRLAIVAGLLVGPFFPASNVLFYVGTFIGERLLYFPSVGFCILAGEVLASWLHPALAPPPSGAPLIWGSSLSRGSSSSTTTCGGSSGSLSGITGAAGGYSSGRVGRLKAAVAAVLLATVLVLFTLKTLARNMDWWDEERLFRSAQKVCWRSAKVQLNSGVVERRHMNWEAAERHFRLAKEIDPTFCEPDFHLGVTLVNKGQDLDEALVHLQRGIACKYVAADSVSTINKVFQALLDGGPVNRAGIGERWAEVLARPEVQRFSEAAAHCESAAGLHAQEGQPAQAGALLDRCLAMLQRPNPVPEGRTPDSPIRVPATPQLLRWLRDCMAARKPVLLVAGGAGGSLGAPAVKRATYRYLAASADACRQALAQVAALPVAEDAYPIGQGYHVQLIHGLQAADPEDPWLQREWGRIMAGQGRLGEALTHLQVSGHLLRHELQRLLAGQRSGVLSFGGRGTLAAEEAAQGALATYGDALQLATAAQQHVVECELMQHVCSVHQLGVAAAGKGRGAASAQRLRLLEVCMEQLARLGCPETAAGSGRDEL